MTPKTEPLTEVELADLKDWTYNGVHLPIKRHLLEAALATIDSLRSPPVPGDIREGVRSLCESEESPHIVADAVLTYLHAQGYRRVPGRDL